MAANFTDEFGNETDCGDCGQHGEDWCPCNVLDWNHLVWECRAAVRKMRAAELRA